MLVPFFFKHVMFYFFEQKTKKSEHFCFIENVSDSGSEYTPFKKWLGHFQEDSIAFSIWF